VFKDPGEEFRRFRSKSSIRRHGKGDKKCVVSLDNGLNVRVSLTVSSRSCRAIQGGFRLLAMLCSYLISDSWSREKKDFATN